jgi:hypothetical protein
MKHESVVRIIKEPVSGVILLNSFLIQFSVRSVQLSLSWMDIRVPNVVRTQDLGKSSVVRVAVFMRSKCKNGFF